MIRKYASAGRLSKKVWDTVSSRFFYLLSDACFSTILERRGGQVEEGHEGKPYTALKVLQSVTSIREDLEAYR